MDFARMEQRQGEGRLRILVRDGDHGAEARRCLRRKGQEGGKLHDAGPLTRSAERQPEGYENVPNPLIHIHAIDLAGDGNATIPERLGDADGHRHPQFMGQGGHVDEQPLLDGFLSARDRIRIRFGGWLSFGFCNGNVGDLRDCEFCLPLSPLDSIQLSSFRQNRIEGRMRFACRQRVPNAVIDEARRGGPLGIEGTTPEGGFRGFLFVVCEGAVRHV